MSNELITASPIDYEEMLKSGMHFGRKRTVFNPKMSKYVFTIRNGICIIDLLKTKTQIDDSIKFLKDTMTAGGTVLFVGLTKQSSDGVRALAEAIGQPYVANRWIGGCLTNFKVITSRVRKLEEMERQLATGELDKYTKKERLMFERQIAKLKRNFEGLRKLGKLPDVVFVSSLKESALPINEARIMGVKVVAVANTDANPEHVEFAIPANDRSKKSVDMILDIMKEELKK
jgi:small subunit ribosomal protein S2